MSLLAGVLAGVGMFLGGIFGMHSSGGMMGTTSPESEHHMASSTPKGPHMEAPVVMGTITAISGTTVTLSVVEHKANDATSTATYSVDASSAKVVKSGNAEHASSTPVSTSALSVGERVLVIGSINGTTITAKTIVEGLPSAMPMGRPEIKMGGNSQATSSSPHGHGFGAPHSSSGASSQDSGGGGGMLMHTE